MHPTLSSLSGDSSGWTEWGAAVLARSTEVSRGSEETRRGAGKQSLPANLVAAVLRENQPAGSRCGELV